MRSFMKYAASLLLVLLTIPLALAESGCFLEKDSSFYCQTIDKEQAAEECLLKQCVLEKSFIPNTPCTPKTYPECEQILCKSSCQLDFAGNCRSGSIPEEHKDEWCTPICCAYIIDDKITCSPQFRQGICESQAKNKNLNAYYTLPAEKKPCQTLCETKINTLKDLNTNEFLKHTLSTSSAQQNTTSSTLKTRSTTSEPTNKSSEQSSSMGFIFFFLLLIGAAIAYFLYTQKKINIKLQNPFDTTQQPSPSELKPTPSITPLNLSLTPQSQVLKQQHQTKVKQHEREDFFHTFGQFATKAQYEGSHLKTLKNLIELYEKKQFTIPQNLTTKEKKALDLLQDLVSKTKQQPLPLDLSPIQKPQPRLTPLQKKKKKELDEVLTALRQISKNP